MNGKIILEGSKRVLGWLAKRWDVIIAPDDLKTKRRIDNVDKAVDVAVKATKAKHDMIDWKIKCYRELGLSKEEIREKLMTDIEKETDPLSVIVKLAKEGAVRRIWEIHASGYSASELLEQED
ncbi:MAG: hypothetical protein ACYSWZ_11460 [Planctomycetota bacterium]|jgi:hypothetical protein